jgi:hypothetical protein
VENCGGRATEDGCIFGFEISGGTEEDWWVQWGEGVRFWEKVEWT